MRTLAYKVLSSVNLPDGSMSLNIGTGYIEDDIFTLLRTSDFVVPAIDAQAILAVEITPGVTRKLDMTTAFGDYLIAQGITDGPLT